MIAKSKIAKLRKFINGPENEVFFRCMLVALVAEMAIGFFAPTGAHGKLWIFFFYGMAVAFALINPEQTKRKH